MFRGKWTGQAGLNMDIQNIHAQKAELRTNGALKLTTDQALLDQSKVSATQANIRQYINRFIRYNKFRSRYSDCNLKSSGKLSDWTIFQRTSE